MKWLVIDVYKIVPPHKKPCCGGMFALHQHTTYREVKRQGIKDIKALLRREGRRGYRLSIREVEE